MRIGHCLGEKESLILKLAFISKLSGLSQSFISWRMAMTFSSTLIMNQQEEFRLRSMFDYPF